MPFWNYNNNEITIKIVYYGPTLSGKTECLRFIYNRAGIKKKRQINNSGSRWCRICVGFTGSIARIEYREFAKFTKEYGSQ